MHLQANKSRPQFIHYVRYLRRGLCLAKSMPNLAQSIKYHNDYWFIPVYMYPLLQYILLLLL